MEQFRVLVTFEVLMVRQEFSAKILFTFCFAFSIKLR